ncbi:hypothetical protein TRIP_E110103 [uncultured Spirochaetota bacterium]|uniref:Uncharacterized protein n=1 Tax=uncultured Spirochaetota bacterium TaxID=460511 RepID=A0A652ZSB0_9SPIR|nr:hypothetical protein TRIP_E110103 [uncultured Spirochaetota bacterium]
MTLVGATLILTPCGIRTGRIPILDIISPELPDRADELAAHLLFHGLLSRDDSAGSGNYQGAVTIEDPRNLFVTGIDAPAGLGQLVHAVQHGVVSLVVLEEDPDYIGSFGLNLLEVLDIAFGLENLDDLKLDPGGHDVDFLVTGRTRVADLCQHVRDGIRNAHRYLLPA